MKSFNSLMKRVILASLVSLPMVTLAQQPTINNLRPYDKTGLNIFETTKNNDAKFDGLKVKIGGAFNQQFQSLKHENSGKVALYPRLSPGFAIAQANLYTDVQLGDGIMLNLTTYLASRHHNEAWVKGGYLQVDKVPFKGEFWEKLMSVTTVKVGHMEINYGDAHFRRSDGGNTIYNPFGENYLMDAFATEVAAEVYVQKNGLLGMVALSNGLINGGFQSALKPGSTTDTYKRAPSVYAKLAYDKAFAEKTRVRVSGSIYSNQNSGRSTLYSGDRTGSNYYFAMEAATATAKDNFTTGRMNPGFSNQITAMQLNIFGKFQGLEVFGTLENAKGSTHAENNNSALGKRKANQFAIDGVYRLGKNEEVFIGARYNVVNGQFLNSNKAEQKVDRTSIAAGWYLLPQVLLKAEYVTQKYADFPDTNILNGGKFNGIVVQAVVGF